MSNNNEEQNVQQQATVNQTTNTSNVPSKKCKYCQSDIPKKAKVCPVCKRKQKKNIILIILLIFVILSFVTCGTMCGVLGSAVNEVAEEQEKEDAKMKELSKKKHKVGDTVKTDDMVIKYISASEYKPKKDDYVDVKKGHKIIKAEFEFQNNSKEDDLVVSSLSFTCNADDYEVETKWIDDNELDADLSPGKKAKGPIYFEVPKDAKSIEIQYESDWWSDYKLTFVVK